jgi:hypothetical protein
MNLLKLLSGNSDSISLLGDGIGPVGGLLDLDYYDELPAVFGNLVFREKGETTGYMEGYAPEDNFCALHCLLGKVSDETGLHSELESPPRVALWEWVDQLDTYLYGDVSDPRCVNFVRSPECVTAVKLNLAEILLSPEVALVEKSERLRVAIEALHENVLALEKDKAAVTELIERITQEIFFRLSLDSQSKVLAELGVASIKQGLEGNGYALDYPLRCVTKEVVHMGEFIAQNEALSAEADHFLKTRNLNLKGILPESRYKGNDIPLKIQDGDLPLVMRHRFFDDQLTHLKCKLVDDGSTLGSEGESTSSSLSDCEGASWRDTIRCYFAMVAQDGYWWNNQDIFMLATVHGIKVTLMSDDEVRFNEEAEGRRRLLVYPLTDTGDRHLIMIHRQVHYSPLLPFDDVVAKSESHKAQLVGISRNAASASSKSKGRDPKAYDGRRATTIAVRLAEMAPGEEWPSDDFRFLSDLYFNSDLNIGFYGVTLTPLLARVIKKHGKPPEKTSVLGSVMKMASRQLFRRGAQMSLKKKGGVTEGEKQRKLAIESISSFINTAKAMAESGLRSGYSQTQREHAQEILGACGIPFSARAREVTLSPYPGDGYDSNWRSSTATHASFMF